MGVRFKRSARRPKMAKRVMAQEKAQEVKEKAQKPIEVNAMAMLKALSIDWLFNGVEENDLNMLNARVTANDKTEWVSFWVQYKRVDGTGVPGIAWGVSTPKTGGFIVMRLVEGGKVLATLKVWPSGKGLLTGDPDIVNALASRPDLPAWTAKDTASLL
jgi:hypothetical protein